MTMPDINQTDLVARLRRGVPDNPAYEVVWVQNMRAFLKEEMFRTFPEWRAIFSAEFETMLAAEAEAATLIETQAAEISRLRDALKPFAFQGMSWLHGSEVRINVKIEDIERARTALEANHGRS
jgi:hypothetical protein